MLLSLILGLGVHQPPVADPRVHTLQNRLRFSEKLPVVHPETKNPRSLQSRDNFFCRKLLGRDAAKKRRHIVVALACHSSS